MPDVRPNCEHPLDHCVIGDDLDFGCLACGMRSLIATVDGRPLATEELDSYAEATAHERQVGSDEVQCGTCGYAWTIYTGQAMIALFPPGPWRPPDGRVMRWETLIDGDDRARYESRDEAANGHQAVCLLAASHLLCLASANDD